jgi:hypothetical protein
MLGGNDQEFYNIYSSEDISEEEKERLFEKIAKDIVERRLGIPAIMFLESIKPLSFVGSQIMIMMNPFIQALFNIKSYWMFSVLFEKRENVECLIKKIERRLDEQKRGFEKDTRN